MRVIVIGLGSMGRRRIRLIKKYNSDIEIVGIDTQVQRRKDAENQYQIKTGTDISEYLSSGLYDCAFICTSPLSHADLINQCLSVGLHVFTEINLVNDRYEENISLAKKMNKILFLSSTPLYRREIEKIRDEVKEQQTPVSYNYHVGQYLPDWHPWESFKNYFVSDKKTNGCRELLAIELPWLVKTFGDIENYSIQKTNTTKLDLNYCDTYQILLSHECGNIGCLQIDVASRKAIRHFFCIGENIHLEWDGTPNSLSSYDIKDKEDHKFSLYNSYDKLDGYSDNIIEDAYSEEIIEFFECICDKKVPRWSFEDDEAILEIINHMEEL